MRSDVSYVAYYQGDSIERLNRLGISRFEKAIPRAGIHPDTPTQLGVKLPRSRMAFRLLYGKTAALGPRSGGPTTIQPHRRGQLWVPARHVRDIGLQANTDADGQRSGLRTRSKPITCSQKVRASRRSRGTLLHALQCRAGASDAARDACYGMGSRDSRVVGRRHSRLTATEGRDIGNRHHEKITGCSDYRLRPGNRPSASIVIGRSS